MLLTIQTLVFLLVVIAVVGVVAARLKIPSSIVLVLTGVVLALIPGLPTIPLAPEIVLLLVLPPIIYASSVAMSWSEFRFNLRPIMLLAVGCVLFTTVATAAAVHYLLGLPWAVGFVLGAIVSPPDAVAPLSIARGMNLPRRLLVVLEGEGLANDATALIIYRFAVAAVGASVFSFGQAAESFAIIVIGELAWGIFVGWLMLRLRRWVRDPRIEITLSIVTPFLAYWVPQHLGGSGVLATMVAGLYISWNGLRFISAATRLQGIFFWDLLIYVINGLVFLITGLQARTLIERIADNSAWQLAEPALIVCGVVILARFVWMYPATYLPRLIPAIQRSDPAPSWQSPFALSFMGVRGIVSLAAALAIPLTINGGVPFPNRDLILFLTFSVILVTLVGQGLLMPAVMRALGLADAGSRERHADRIDEFEARRQAIEVAVNRLDQMIEAGHLPDDFIGPVRAYHRDRLSHASQRSDDSQRELINSYDDIEALVIGAERDTINDLYRAGKLKDEARRRIERELDLREARLASLRGEA